MSELKCPHCGHTFEPDETAYESIVSQIKNAAFMQEVEAMVNSRMAAVEQSKATEIENAKLLVAKQYDEQQRADKDALMKAKSERDEAVLRLETAKKQSDLDVQAAVNKQKSEDEQEMKRLQTELEYYKDLKTKMSTKMVGETLEQHCQIQFDQIRMAAFPSAYFEKDNEVSETGSKGDFIFRDFDGDMEYISIMFEMKNEMDTTASKHKNEDFLKELDKDRKEKGCEYAVLVSMLEADSEYYNAGIVDMSYRYPKMYVIRPQFFIPIITILRNAARSSLDDKRALMQVQMANIDIVNFENNLEEFKDNMQKSYDQAHNRYDDAIAAIDRSIKSLEKVKDMLTKSDKHLLTLNNKANSMTVRKLAKDSPSILKDFGYN